MFRGTAASDDSEPGTCASWSTHGFRRDKETLPVKETYRMAKFVKKSFVTHERQFRLSTPPATPAENPRPS